MTKSYFDDVTDSMPETLQKRNINEYVFLQIFRSNFSLKNVLELPFLESIYCIKMHLQNTSKNLQKICD